MGQDDARWEAILDACVGLAEDLVIVFCEPEDEGCFEETFDAIVDQCLAEAGAALEEEDIYEDIHDACSAMAEEEAGWECADDEGNLDEDCFWMLYDALYSECFAASEESWDEEAAMWEEVFYYCESLADEVGWLECTDEEGNTDEECHADVSHGVFEECMAEAEAAMAEEAARVDACAGLADEVAMAECAIEEDIAHRLVLLGNDIRNISNIDLEEGVSTRALIHAAKLIKRGVPARRSCSIAIAQAITDERDEIEAIEIIIEKIFGA